MGFLLYFMGVILCFNHLNLCRSTAVIIDLDEGVLSLLPLRLVTSFVWPAFVFICLVIEIKDFLSKGEL